MGRHQQNEIYLILMNGTVMHLGRNNSNQHRYLGNINIEKDLGVAVDNEVQKSSHCKTTNWCSGEGGVKRDLLYV